MSEHAAYPSYNFPTALLIKIFLSATLNKRRILAKDAKIALKEISPPVEFSGVKNIPLNGPGLVTMNRLRLEQFMKL